MDVIGGNKENLSHGEARFMEMYARLDERRQGDLLKMAEELMDATPCPADPSA